ncbi:MAG: HlyD family efflux transporter periplasmic adaptor subunit [Chloroflexi bacterium]|nr:HlyD family efflux transporter periplasmic adaptor subunit [Chloroflexota bacterium]MBV9897666.1 HlyD family efflux transporter periplasmic adaptor subunit [Chloroflexota bacterium]
MSVQVQGPQQRPVAEPNLDGHGRPASIETDAPVAPSRPTGPGPAPAAAAVEVPPPTPRRRPAFLSRRVLLPVLALIVIVVGLFGFNAWRDSALYVSTDNAQLSGQPVQVGAMNAGKVDAIMPGIGAAVHKGDVIAQVALPSQVGVGQGGQPKMGFLGAGDTHVDVTAPVDGIVIAEPVAVGATVAAGQPIVSVVDPSALYVNANIEETNIARVRVGQPVTVHVDALGADIPGKVEAVTPATAGTFSILPSSNTSGNFTKVTQLVPVRISVNLGNQPMLVGANVEVKIRVGD